MLLEFCWQITFIHVCKLSENQPSELTAGLDFIVIIPVIAVMLFDGELIKVMICM